MHKYLICQNNVQFYSEVWFVSFALKILVINSSKMISA